MRSGSVSLAPYIQINVSGYNTAGYSFDIDSFMEDNGSKLRLTDEAVSWSDAHYYEDYSIAKKHFMEVVLSGDYGWLSPSAYISDGDTVTFEWSITQDDFSEWFENEFVLEPVTKKINVQEADVPG